MAEYVTELNAATFDEAIKGDKPVLVDFWAVWCGPCRMMSPVVDKLAAEYADKLFVGKVNVDEVSELAERYSVSSIPTLILFKNGAMVDRTVGLARPRCLRPGWIGIFDCVVKRRSLSQRKRALLFN